MKAPDAIILAVTALACSVMATPSQGAVCKEPVSLSCFKKNFTTFYRKDYDHFFAAFNKFDADVLSCKSNQSASAFLGLVIEIQGNAEVSEAFAESVEKMIVAKPACFLNAASSLDERSQKLLVQQYLKVPTFQEEREIRKVMKRYKSDMKYRPIMSYYFGE